MKLFEITPKILFCFIPVLLFPACQPVEKTVERPNILWLYLEDTSPVLGSYGSNLVTTPHIDGLAARGTIYSQAFAPAPVCSASRSSVITGVMSTTLGLHNHHSSRTEASAIYLPDSIKTLPEIFKDEGYFTFNNGKDDYNFTYDRKKFYDQDVESHPLYGKRGVPVPLSELGNRQPFFGQIQLRGGKEIFSSSFKERVKDPVDRNRIQLPPYLPNHPTVIEEYANHLDAINITDDRVGQIMEELEAAGVLENTIIFFYSDHGMRLTRHKQFLYDGGLRVPLIISDFTKTLPGSRDDQLVSGLDLGPTALGLANISIPSYVEGRDIFDEQSNERAYIVATRDRCDFTIDRIRAIRSKRFKYIRNYLTDRPYLQPTYMDVNEVPFVITMKQLYQEGKLDSVQSRFLSGERPYEELYEITTDSFEVNNLIGNPAYEAIRKEFAEVLDTWESSTDDQGQYPESEEGLKYMLGIWGDHAVNPEYIILREKYPELSGSLLSAKNQSFQSIDK